jgi:hypothetical protein
MLGSFNIDQVVQPGHYMSGSHDAHSLVPTTRTGKFMVRWPRTSAAPFCSLHMWSGWCTNSLTLRPRTCGRPVVSQPLGAPNQYWAPSLRRLWPKNNTRLISPSNINNSRWIMNNSARWSWTWNHRWVVHVHSFLAVWSWEWPTSSSSFSNSAIVLFQFFCTMNIWILYYLIWFLYFLILYNFICLISFFNIILYNFILFILHNFIFLLLFLYYLLICWRTLFRQTYSIDELVDKIFTDGMVILCWRKNSVGKTIKCCSDVTLCFLDFEIKKHYI